MRASSALTFLAIMSCLLMGARACIPDQAHNGCKIVNSTMCICGYGCKSEYIYKTRKTCKNAIRGPAANPDICSQAPCFRGICIQTTQGSGFICRCEGTGFYGQRCNRACPTVPLQGFVYPHECIVI